MSGIDLTVTIVAWICLSLNVVNVLITPAVMGRPRECKPYGYAEFVRSLLSLALLRVYGWPRAELVLSPPNPKGASRAMETADDIRDRRREAIRESADSHCRGLRYEAADRHVEAKEIAEQITGHKSEPSAYHSFLAGFDAALELTGSGELLEENQRLHGIIIDLCTRAAIEKCPHCNGEYVNDEIETCPHCQLGWIDKPKV